MAETRSMWESSWGYLTKVHPESTAPMVLTGEDIRDIFAQRREGER